MTPRPLRSRVTRRHRPAGRVLTAAVAVITLAVACSTTPDHQAEPVVSGDVTTTTEGVHGPLPDQTPPRSTFGVAFHDNQLWVVDFYGGEILAVDPDSGSILRRLHSEDNVSGEVDNLAIGSDGVLFWTGYNDGAIGRISTNNVGLFLDAMPPGVCAIALSPDGKKLYVGGSITGSAPLWAIDPLKQERFPPISTNLAIRAFTVGVNGKIYGPRFGTTATADRPGALLEVDPTDGSVVEVVSGLDGPIAAERSVDGRSIYVLSLPPGRPPTLQSVDLATHAITPLPSPMTPLAANLAVAPDGRIFVTSYNQPDVSIISKDGTVKTLAIGQRALK